MGCAKNLVDSEVILTQLRGNNIQATHESNEGQMLSLLTLVALSIQLNRNP